MSRTSSLQDPFLNALRKEKINVSIYLLNGIKLQGQVEAFDRFCIVLKNTVNQIVYKHAISTIIPAKSIKIIFNTCNNFSKKQEEKDINKSYSNDIKNYDNI